MTMWLLIAVAWVVLATVTALILCAVIRNSRRAEET